MPPKLTRLLQGIGLLLALALTSAAAAWIAMALVVVEPSVTVPDLTRLQPEEARERLAAAGLHLETAGEVYSDQVDRGHVAEQEPAAGDLLKPGRAVKVQLSRGASRTAVPRVAGEPLRQARLLLAHRGLAVGEVVQVHDAGRPPGTVLAQEPPPMTLAEPGARVNLVVSAGRPAPEYLMPDLINRSFEQVAAALQARGFRIEPPLRRGYPGLLPGIIIRQYPEPGYRLRRETPIRLEVSA